ncbi:pyridoxamine 5'-phosphate oxidase family protein [Pseudonocardia sp. GCM10023141]|uniref:pyridoxamine 5'-phosphate oxidase family protein n=1 Tax=Pseudonocardia sp. GCM10023141 TaxID=3252653 RepID=UPI00361EA705
MPEPAGQWKSRPSDLHRRRAAHGAAGHVQTRQRGDRLPRTARECRLAQATRHDVVAFEADEIDPATLRGWSVLGAGHTYEVTDQERLAGLLEPTPIPWAPAGPTVTIAVRLQRLTGRRLCPSPDTLV